MDLLKARGRWLWRVGVRMRNRKMRLGWMMGRSLRTIKRIKDEDDEDYKFIVKSLGPGTKQGPLKINELF